jgi:hypothetical protein
VIAQTRRSQNPSAPTHTAFGLHLASELPLPGLRPSGAREADVAIRWATKPDVVPGDAMPEMTPVWRTRFADGCVVVAEVGQGGNQRLTYGNRACFDISSDAAVIECCARDRSDPSWQRFLLDTVLWWVCLSRGSEALHAGAVELPYGVVAIAARSGGGKTTLAVELLRRGHRLFADDVIVYTRDGDALIAQPGPPLMNLPTAAGDIADLGTPLARFEEDDEAWVAVHRSAEAPAALAAIVVLDRALGRPLGIEQIDATVIDLIPHVWGLPHSDETARQSFEAVSEIVRLCPVFRLSADLDVPPARLAAHVEGVVGRHDIAAGAPNAGTAADC